MGKCVRRRLTNEHKTNHNYTDDYDFVKRELDTKGDSFDMGRGVFIVQNIDLYWTQEILASTVFI